MKKILLTLTVALAALMLTQCKKNVEQIENNAINGGLTGETIEVSLTAGTGGEKTDIDGLTVQWLAGDKIYVAGSEDGYLGYLTAQEGGNPVEFKGLIRKTTTSQTYYFYYVGDNEFALGGTNNDEFTFSVEEQYGILSDDANSIANRFQLAKGSKAVEGTPGHDLGNVTLNSMMAISRLNLQVSGTSMGGASTDIVTVSGVGCYSTGTLNIKTGALAPNVGNITLKKANNDYFMVLIPENQTDENSQNLKFTASSNHDEVSCVKAKVVANGFYNYNTTKAVNMTSWLPGDFTVRGDNTKVKFSKSNLWCNSTVEPKTFWFEDEQWMTVPSAVGQNGTSGTYSAEHISDFLWSPDKNVATSTTETLSGEADDVPFTNATEETPNPSFSVNGETGTNAWRLLSVAEWSYVFNMGGSTDVSEGRQQTVRFAMAKVCNVNGMILFPDGYTGITSDDGMAAINNATATYPTNSISPNTWLSMEADGAVFLPATGHRHGTTVDGIGRNANYWTSTPYGTDNGCNMYFYSGYANFANDSRWRGFTVRLVRSSS